MRLVSSVRLLPLLLLTCLISEARGFDRPTIEMRKRAPPPLGAQVVVSPSAGLGVSGQIVPPMRVPVEVLVEHQFEDGKTLQQLKVTVQADADGQFVVGFDPPRGGWLPGQNRTVVCIQNLRRVTDGETWTAVGPPAQSADFPDAVVPLLKADRDVDLGQTEDLPPLVSERTYLLKGSFPHNSQAEGTLGPPVLVEFRQPTEKNLDGIICESWIMASFPRDERTCNYEIEVPLKRHLEPGLYLLRTTIPIKPGAVPNVRSIRILPRDEADDPEKQ
ncbi:hypothetical protein VT03_18655 [Planctomyces sp. SH-PL14]|nr:hypothetical protein VT03_18655 [Planctomyces sp. SH-PL14]